MVALPRRWPASPVRRDVVLVVATALLLLASVRIAYTIGAVPPTPSTYLMAALIAVPLVVRRRYPLGVLFACSALLLLFYAVHPDAGVPPAVPLGVALYAAAEYGHLRWALVISLFFMVAGAVALISSQHQPSVRVLTELALMSSLLGAICLLGDAVHSRRGWAAEIRDRLAQAAEAAAAEREREGGRRVAEERLRIARDLHDVLAHTISALTIQARVIKDGLPDAPPEIRAAADAILSTSREAMVEVRATVGLLRGADDEGPTLQPPAPGVAQLDAVLATARSSGLRARCDTVGTPVPLPAATDLTAYRIVQEALTNVVRHAGAATVTATLRYRPGLLEVQVDDDGRGPARTGAPTGYGLIGMRERASAVGGEVEAGAGPDGGFRVLARLPVPGAA
ncbi:MAG: hypothetical protein QOE61_5286 [Micromonosporaceae bacterium]|nr:hypothetical protein [Micromonosporaceae bacterium]